MEKETNCMIDDMLNDSYRNNENFEKTERKEMVNGTCIINKTTFKEGNNCDCLNVLIVDKSFETKIKTFLTKGRIFKEINTNIKIHIDGNRLHIETKTHFLTVTLEDD